MIESLQQAEQRANKRDLDRNIDLTVVAQEEQKANANGYTIVKKKKTSKVAFAQIIQPNLAYLTSKSYLTNAEMAFLLSLTNFVELHSNAIVQKRFVGDRYESNGQFCTVSYIAEALGKNLSNTSKLINELINKSIIFEFVDAYEIKMYGRVVSERPLFFNPEIVYAGDRDKINATLAKLVMQYNRLEKNKMYLPYKLLIQPNQEYGKIVTRKYYLAQIRSKT